MNDRYLVTGAQGFLGRYLSDLLLNRHEQATVLGIGRSPRQNECFLHSLRCRDQEMLAPLPEHLQIKYNSRYVYIPVDLVFGEITSVIRAFKPTVVIHLAASLRGATNQTIKQNNKESTASLFRAVITSCTKLQTLLFASSGSVYGKQEKQPIEEGARVSPIGSYAQSKLDCEALTKDFASRSGTPPVIARIFNVLGPGQDELHIAGRMAARMGEIVAHNVRPLVQTNSLQSSRDFLDVRDVCVALAMLVEQRCQGVFNVGSGVETSVEGLIQLFTECAGLVNRARIEQDNTRFDPIPRHVANIQSLRQTGFVPKYSLKESCREMFIYNQTFVHRQCRP